MGRHTYRIFALALLCLGVEASAQQLTQFGRFDQLSAAFNPAVVGSTESMEAFAWYRQQWAGIEGSPSSQAVMVQTPFKSSNVGVGGIVLSDGIGPIRTTHLQGALSYRVKFNRQVFTQFGLSLGGRVTSSQVPQLQTVDTDPTLAGANPTSWAPFAGTGAWLSAYGWEVGLSVPNILSPNVYSAYQVAVEGYGKRHLYFSLGKDVRINESLVLHPRTLVKLVGSAPLQTDLLIRAEWNEQLHMGALWRTGMAFGVFGGMRFTEQLTASYLFEVTSKRIAANNFGTHELMLSYRFRYASKENVQSPRAF